MSARKRRFEERRLAVLRMIQKSENQRLMLCRFHTEWPALKQLEQQGRIKRIRKSIGSSFGWHIRRTYFVINTSTNT